MRALLLRTKINDSDNGMDGVDLVVKGFLLALVCTEAIATRKS